MTAASNRLTNAAHDLNGNMTSGAGATLGYDAAKCQMEGRPEVNVRSCVTAALFLSATSFAACCCGQSLSETRSVCGTVSGLLTVSSRYNVPPKSPARVEIHLCEPGGSETLQLVAWRAGAREPALVVQTEISELCKAWRVEMCSSWRLAELQGIRCLSSCTNAVFQSWF